MAQPHKFSSNRLLATACGLGAVLLAAGCRNLDNAQVDVLERELRQQEDYIYELEGHLVEYSEKLRQARLAQCSPSTEVKSPTSRPEAKEPTLDVTPPAAPLPSPSTGRGPRQPLTEAPPAAAEPASPPATAAPAAEPPPAETPPATESAPGDAPPAEPTPVDPSQMEVPELEIGPGADSRSGDAAESLAYAPVLASEADPGPLLIPDPVDYQADEPPPVAAPLEPAAAIPTASETLSPPQLAAPLLAPPRSPLQQPDAPRLAAERLEIRRVFGEPPSDDDGTFGKLLVVVEALSSADEPVSADGEVSMMVMSRDAPNSFQRIDRWDFTAAETAAAWQSSQFGDGLHLELPLHAAELPPGDLELWARVVMPDGRKLLTQMPLVPTQLASMSDAEETLALAAADDSLGRDRAMPIPTQGNAQVAKPDQPVTRPAPRWRAATTPIESTPIESATAGTAGPAAAQGGGGTTGPGSPEPANDSTAGRRNARWKQSSASAPRRARGSDAEPSQPIK